MTRLLRPLFKLITTALLSLALVTMDATESSASSTSEAKPLVTSGIDNGEFDSGTTDWSLDDWTGEYIASMAVVTDAGMSGVNALKIDMTGTTSDDWKLQLVQNLNFNLEYGRTYRVTFQAKAEVNRSIVMSLYGDSGWNYVFQSFNLTTSAQTFTFDYECTDSDADEELAFFLKFYLGQSTLSDVWFDNVSVEDVTPQINVTNVSIGPDLVVINQGQTWQLEKSIEPFNATNQNVAWSSSNTAVATISASGIVTGVSSGISTITATTSDGGFTATSTVRVALTGTPFENGEFDSGTTSWALDDFTSNPTGSMSVVSGAGLSGTNALKIDVVNADSDDWTLQLVHLLNFRVETGKTYRISFMAKAESARDITVSLYGSMHILNYAFQNFTLSTAAQTYSFNYTCSETLALSEPNFALKFYLAKGVISDVWLDKVVIEDITGAIPVTDVSVTPELVVLNVGQTWQLNKLVEPATASNQNVVWSSSNSSIVAVSSAGVVSAVSPGIATITASSVDGNHSAVAAVRVAASGETILENGEFDSGTTGWTFLDYTPTPTASMSTVTGAGLSGTNALRIDVTNNHNDDWKLQVFRNLNVRLVVGKTYRISFKAKSESNRSVNVSLYGNSNHSFNSFNLTSSPQAFSFDYQCQDSEVESAPSFSLRFYLALGVISDVWLDQVAIEDITGNVNVTGVSLSNNSLSLNVYETFQLLVNVLPASATNREVTWSSSNPAIATVSSTGLVTGVATGSATITATTVNGGYTSQSSVTVLAGQQLAAGYKLAWNGILGAVDNSNFVLTKTASVGWDNAGATSENQLLANQDGWIEFKIDNNNANGSFVVGFSTVDNTYLRSSIEYGLEINSQTQRVLFHESSDTGTDLANWSGGDVFRISRNGSLIKYYKNGNELRSIDADATKAYKIKALLNEGKTYPAASSFWIPASRGLVPDAWEFNVLKQLYDSLGGSAWTNKTSWGTPNSWAVNITAAQMDAWYGITVASGDITRLELRTNHLVGKIPQSIGNLTSLLRLMLDVNNLTGPIPASIGNLTKLQYLYLYDNQLTGDLPSSMGNLTKMQYLAFHKNKVTGNFDWIGKMTDMVQFYYYANPNLSCTIPSSIGKLTKMTRLAGGGYVGTNQYVHSKVHGPIPDSLRFCIKLEGIWLDNSEFTGPVPSLTSLTNLETLSLFNNPTLTGNLNTFTAGLTKLSSIHINNSGIGGTVSPNSITTLLQYLYVGKTQITALPSNLTSATNLLGLGLDSLQLSEIPNWGTSFNKLTYLSAQGNALTSFPTFTSHVNKANLEIFVQNNKLDFSDIESNFTAAGVHPFKTFVYSPQPNPLTVPADLSVVIDNELKIEAPSGGTHGVYLWEKMINGTWTSVNAQNQSSVPNEFVRTNSQESDAGTYRYTVTNSWVPNLSFESGPIEVLTSDAPVTSVNALYNGIITSVRWRTDKAYGTSEEDYSGMYVYEYDDKYQIKDASWASQDLAGSVSFGNKFRLTGMEYDPNGNIMALKRYNTDGHKIHNFDYQYGFEETSPQNDNKLKSIAGYVNAYTYNAVGQMIGEDKIEGGDQYVEYDVTGKVTKVYSSAAKLPADLKIENIYDDRGFRLAKINFATQRTTWYVRDASGNVISIYEQEGVEAQSVEGVEPVVTANGIVQTEVPLYGSGKLATYYPAQDASVSYEITDHLGNVRALLREGTMVFTATMEDNNQEDVSNPRVAEMTYFQNLFETEVDDVNMNHTSPTATVVQNPSRSAYLFWQDGVPGIQATDKSTGPAIAREVSGGDIIKAEAFVRYENKLSYTRGGITLGILSSLLGSSFTTVGLFEGSTLSQTTQIFNDALSLAGFLDDNDDETRPFAYISYIVFNEGKESIASDRVRVSVDAGFDPSEAGLANQHEHLQFENDIVVAPEGKFIYLWVSNESEDTRVWFDDFTVTHQSTFVAQATDYGVWGDVLREQKSDVLEKYRFGYQGQFAEKDEETGWNHFELREYDPVIGRWTVTDPYGQYWSPYTSVGNNPINSIDASGGYSQGWAKFLAWITPGVDVSDVYEEGGEYGYNTIPSGGGIESHFGDERSWANNWTLDKAQDQWILSNLSTPDRIMYQYGGNAVDFDPMGQYMLGELAIGSAKGLTYGGIRLGQGLLFGTSNRVFWSGGFLRSAGEAARDYAIAHGAITLEMTPVGVSLTKLTELTSYNFTKPLWKLASKGFANGAEGSATVFINPVRLSSRSIWMNTERSILRANGVRYYYKIIY